MKKGEIVGQLYDAFAKQYKDPTSEHALHSLNVLCVRLVFCLNVHMSWMRIIVGRLEMRYRYAPSVYNNFPWPDQTDEQKTKIEETAQGILDARALYPDSSLADCTMN